MERKVNIERRKKMVVAMEMIARCINDEDIFESWLIGGVADGDFDADDMNIDGIEVDEYYTDNTKGTEDDPYTGHFDHLMTLFLKMMVRAWKSGGLYCDGVCSREYSDFHKENN